MPKASLGLTDEHRLHHHSLRPTSPILTLPSLLVLMVKPETEKNLKRTVVTDHGVYLALTKASLQTTNPLCQGEELWQLMTLLMAVPTCGWGRTLPLLESEHTTACWLSWENFPGKVSCPLCSEPRGSSGLKVWSALQSGQILISIRGQGRKFNPSTPGGLGNSSH